LRRPKTSLQRTRRQSLRFFLLAAELDIVRRSKYGTYMTTVRAEEPSDVSAIRQVNELAFETSTEARLVDVLREGARLLVSLVAEDEGRVVGHIAFSRVRIASALDLFGLGLGPMAVLPSFQNRGIGSRLVREGLLRCRALGACFVVVLGHAHFYPRFGFVTASQFQLSCSWPVPEGVFMAIELNSGSLAGAEGPVSYEPEFNDT
jgi:putative acetyltransferase